MKDRGFCSPKIDQAAVEARKKKELEEEMKRVKEEYEEKQKKKKEEKAKKEKEKEKEKDKDKDGKDKEKDKAEKSADDKEKPDGEVRRNCPSPASLDEKAMQDAVARLISYAEYGGTQVTSSRGGTQGV